MQRPETRRRRWEGIVLLGMYLGYASFMFCRNSLIASSPAMIQEGVLDKEQYGRLMSADIAGSIMGKLLVGPAADRFGGRRTFLLTLGLTAGSTVAFGLASGFGLFVLLNFLGQFFKAGGWPAMAKIIGVWYPPGKHGRIWGVVSTSSRMGTILAGLVLGWLLLSHGWREVFMISGAATCVVLAVCFVLLKDSPEAVGLSASVAPEGAPDEEGAGGTEPDGGACEAVVPPPHPLDDKPLAAAIGYFAQSPRVWFMSLALAFLTPMMDFLTFLPVYLQETLGVASGEASMAGAAFPAGMFVSVLMAGFVYDRLSKRSLIGAIGGMLLVSVACIVTLRVLPSLGLSSTASLRVALVTIFLMGVGVAPAYYIPMSVFSIAFGGRHSGFLVSILDVFGYLGSLVFVFFGGTIATDHGWPVFLAVLLAISLSATASMVAFLWLDHRAEARSAVA